MIENPNARSLTRRQFLQRSAAGLAGAGLATGLSSSSLFAMPVSKNIRLRRVDANFEREPLVRPFGFKGGFLTEIWQAVSYMESEAGTRGVGLGTQSVLWSDAEVFAQHSESGGNALMYALTERALQMAREVTFTTPHDLLDAIFDELYAYGQRITGKTDLRKTFILNALVGVDNAAWLVYARENGLASFDALVPERYRPGLGYRHRQVASVPVVSYNTPIDAIREAVEDGYFFLKIKLGQPGTQREMLEKDMERLAAIHRAIGHLETPHTADGKIPYYFDANGRYEEKDSLLRLLDHARQIGAFDQILVVEEPFPEANKAEVGDVGVLVASDESAHTDADAAERIDLGYGAIALKAVAKTMTMTQRIAQLAHERGVPCFCADLTVNPILVDWNKTVAARLAPLPGLSVGLQEVNGHQNYKHWERMQTYHPCPDAPWSEAEDGVYTLGAAFYDRSACILEPSAHYRAMFDRTTSS